MNAIRKFLGWYFKCFFIACTHAVALLIGVGIATALAVNETHKALAALGIGQ